MGTVAALLIKTTAANMTTDLEAASTSLKGLPVSVVVFGAEVNGAFWGPLPSDDLKASIDGLTEPNLGASNILFAKRLFGGQFYNLGKTFREIGRHSATGLYVYQSRFDRFNAEGDCVNLVISGRCDLYKTPNRLWLRLSSSCGDVMGPPISSKRIQHMTRNKMRARRNYRGNLSQRSSDKAVKHLAPMNRSFRDDGPFCSLGKLSSDLVEDTASIRDRRSKWPIVGLRYRFVVHLSGPPISYSVWSRNVSNLLVTFSRTLKSKPHRWQQKSCTSSPQ